MKRLKGRVEVYAEVYAEKLRWNVSVSTEFNKALQNEMFAQSCIWYKQPVTFTMELFWVLKWAPSLLSFCLLSRTPTLSWSLRRRLSDWRGLCLFLPSFLPYFFHPTRERSPLTSRSIESRFLSNNASLGVFASRWYWVCTIEGALEFASKKGIIQLFIWGKRDISLTPFRRISFSWINHA